jgi:hypothetical protein
MNASGTGSCVRKAGWFSIVVETVRREGRWTSADAAPARKLNENLDMGHDKEASKLLILINERNKATAMPN